LPALACYLLAQFEMIYQWIPREPMGVWVVVILLFLAGGFFYARN
jgi:hypothetical protein